MRTYQEAGLPLNEAIQKSIHQCIDQGILREFLEKNGSEVRNMVLTEWDENEARRVAAEEAREETREKIMKEEREARRIAIEETREKVMKEERQNTVRSMKEQGLPEELIARVVKLPVEQVKKILEA